MKTLSKPDAICGACGNRYEQHFIEKYQNEVRVYCNKETTGDIFTDEPTADEIISLMEQEHPDLLEGLVNQWKRLNGHYSY
jgi:hypothetical protein